ncbi:MAG: hypothetical protein LWX56_06705 [Ignavibacteria bacterium]|nr:hypothetical protein [Ignavibacteria bacterium]
MKKILILLCLSIPIGLFGQLRPNGYKLENELPCLGKGAYDTPSSNTINDIVIVGDTVWVATSNGLSMTVDKGQSWTRFYQDAVFGTESVVSLAYDKKTHSLWASTAHNTDQNGSSYPEGSGLRVTTNGGVTWLVVPQSLDNDNDITEQYGANSLRALPVTTKIQNITYDIAITGNTIWTASFAGGLRKNKIDSLLVDPKRSWKRVVLPPDNRTKISPTDQLDFCLSPVAGKFCSESNLNYRLFSLTAVGDTVLYAGSAAGINKTSMAKQAEINNDLVWERFQFQQSSNNSISGNFVVGLDYNASSNTVWAATWRANDTSENTGVSFSQNGGASWNRVLTDEKVHAFANCRNLTIALADNGPFRTYDFGNTWSLPALIVDSKTGLKLGTKIFYSGAFTAKADSLWLGSGNGLVVQDGNQPGWGSSWKLFASSPKLTSRSETYAFPNPFSPKLDGVIKIKYSTNGANEQVTIRIFNFGMKYIRTVVQNATRGSVHQVDGQSNGVNGVIDYWDGKDDSGNIVPNGVYFYRVDVGSQEPSFGKIMVLQ